MKFTNKRALVVGMESGVAAVKFIKSCGCTGDPA